MTASLAEGGRSPTEAREAGKLFGIRFGREQAQRAMRSFVVMQMPVIGEDDAGFTQRIDEFTVQALAAEDYSSIAQTLSQLTRTMESEIEALRQKAISVSQEYAQDKYHLRFRQFWEAILSHPPVANPPTRRRRASLMDQIPMGLLRRLDSRALFRKQPLF